MKTRMTILYYELAEKFLKLGFDYECIFKYDENKMPVFTEKWTTDYKVPGIFIEQAKQFLKDKYIKNLCLFPIKVGNATISFLGYAYIAYYNDDPTPDYDLVPYETENEAMIAGINHVVDKILNHELDKHFLDSTIS